MVIKEKNNEKNKENGEEQGEGQGEEQAEWFERKGMLVAIHVCFSE